MREERFHVNFAVFLMWQEKSGAVHRVTGRCLDLSSEGMRAELRDRVATGTAVVVESHEFGRMGHATVKYCRRESMRFLTGLRFSAAFGLGDPTRKKVLERVLRPGDQDTAPSE